MTCSAPFNTAHREAAKFVVCRGIPARYGDAGSPFLLPLAARLPVCNRVEVFPRREGGDARVVERAALLESGRPNGAA